MKCTHPGKALATLSCAIYIGPKIYDQRMRCTDERPPARAFHERSLGPGNIPMLRRLFGHPRVQPRVQTAAGGARADLPPVHRHGPAVGARGPDGRGARPDDRSVIEDTDSLPQA